MIQHWLNILSPSLPGIRRAIVIETDADSKTAILARWPATLTETDDLQALVQLVSQNKPILVQQAKNESGESLLQIAHLIKSQSLQSANLAISLEAEADLGKQQVFVNLLQWADQWLSLGSMSLKQSAEVAALSLADVASLLESADLRDALRLCIDQLASQFDVDSLLLALGKPDEFKISVISQLPVFDRRASLLRDAERCLNHSNAETGKQLLKEYEFEQIEIRFFPNSAIIFCNKLDKKNFDAAIKSMQPILSVIDACIGQNLAVGTNSHLDEATPLSPLQRLRKYWIIAVICALLVVTSLVETDFTVNSPATLEGKVQRAIVAPFDGYIEQQFARAGDTVHKNDAIAQLDATEFTNERRLWLANKAEAEKQYRQALGELRQSEAQIHAAKLEQAEAQLAIIDRRLMQAKLLAPIDGVIIRGDLSRALDAPVSRGDILFEIAPEGEYRLATFVPESEISLLKPGQSGYVALDALPDQTIPFTVTHIALATEQTDGSVAFRVEAKLDDQYLALARPGMTGIAKIDIKRASILWIYAHPIINWLQLKAWKWLP